jgi:DNA processing protein
MTDRGPLRHLTDTPRSLTAALRIITLGNVGVNRARWLLGTVEPEAVVERLLRGQLPPELPPPATELRQAQVAEWRDGLRRQDVDAIVAANIGNDHLILGAGHDAWPFSADPHPPVLLFVRGDPDLLVARRRIAVVGTRRCSAVGRAVAREIGASLTEAGISVVSGLALGIDAAAHQGARSASVPSRCVGVVASGLDMVYPAGNRRLWHDIANDGVLISETPMGERPTRWRFPARNRLIAGLSELVVIVESHRRGGALHTVDEAAARGIDVAAVPGSVASSASEGTNELLMDGVAPVRTGQDILEMVGIDPGSATEGTSPTGSVPVGCGAEPIPDIDARLLDEVSAGPVHLDDLLARFDLAPAKLLAMTQRLARSGHLCVDGSMIGRSHGEEH